ncbi:DUF481 domain-containing protein [Thalassotalea psychrophila]|uniref:DUF481 domain-containing protein n=1 Tax=Thalassotalea psychrophila TaxID=3065647 RepID=A0ABY9TWJ8_9GAMM|nr:DUF481 domain-containing protein [Colwelliaceae bacterium SQ149]
MKYNLLVISIALASSAVMAEEEVKLWSGDIDFGYTNLTGNTEETTTSGKVHVLRENAPWKWVGHIESLYSESNDEKSAERWGGFTRLEYNFTDHNYIFGRVSYDEDKFSGYDSQSTATAGFGWNLIKSEEMDWDFEAGAGYRSAKVEDPLIAEDEEEVIYRLSTLFQWQFSPTSSFVQLLSTEVGDENTISLSESAIKVQVIGQVSLKVSYIVKHTDEVPVGIEDTDTETVVSVTYSF